MGSKRDQDETEFFIQKYSKPRTSTSKLVERTVLGHEFGLNGFTTVVEADRLRQTLKLGPGDRLLDVGAGFGWPGLAIAQSSGCRLVSSDMPLPALLQAQANAASLALVSEVDLVAADGRLLPFRSRSFQAIAHADLL